MHRSILMLDTVKDFMSSVGCTTQDLARRVGDNTVDIARRVGDNTVDIARRVGPKRGIIGFLVLGAAIGGSFYLVRYLRARAAEMEGEEERTPMQKRERRARETARSLQH